MYALTEFLFPAPAERSPGAILSWWEARRLPFNAILGVTGVLTIGLVELLRTLPPAAAPMPPALPIVFVYGVLANFCYCAGPLTEIVVERVWGRKLLPVGPSLFRIGLTFSMGLTLFPALIMALDWPRRVIVGLL